MRLFGLEIERAEPLLFVRRRHALRRKSVQAGLVGTAAFVVMGTGIAYAAWSSTATGSGAAKSGEITFTIETTSTTAAGDIANTLRPGSAAGTASGGDLALTLNNDSGFALTVESVAVNGSITSDKAGCTSANHGVSLGTGGTYTPTSTVVAGDGQDHDVVFANALSMAESSNTACQGATFTIPVLVTVTTPTA